MNSIKRKVAYLEKGLMKREACEFSDISSETSLQGFCVIEIIILEKQVADAAGGGDWLGHKTLNLALDFSIL